MSYDAKPGDIKDLVHVDTHTWNQEPHTDRWQDIDDLESSTTENALSKALVRRQDLRILPLSALCYFILNIDRSNVGNAKTMNADTKDDLLTDINMSDYEYIVALMIFFIIYAYVLTSVTTLARLTRHSLAEVPSNYLLKKFAPSTWIAFLMFSWGAITIGIGGVRSFASFTATRFLLGLFEAGTYKLIINNLPPTYHPLGLFPGIIYHLSKSHRPLITPLPTYTPSFLVPRRRTQSPHRPRPCERHSRRRVRRRHRLRRRPHERPPRPRWLALALHHRRRTHLSRSRADLLLPAQLPRDRKLAVERREGTCCRSARRSAGRCEAHVEGLQGCVCGVEVVRALRSVLCYLLSVQLFGFLHAHDHGRAGICGAAEPVDDSPPVCCCVRRHGVCVVVCRPI